MINGSDICGSCGDITVSADMNVCVMCGKHICDNCVCYDYHERMITNSPDPYCEECWDIGKPYRVLINKAELELDIKKEGIRSDWYDEINRIKIGNITHELINLFGEDKTEELMVFMRENDVTPINITERPQFDDRSRYAISTAGGTVELSDGTYISIPIKIYVTYNRIADVFTYMTFLSDPL